MKITHTVKMNLETMERLQRLEMPQGDVNSREIEMYLYANQSLWIIPEDATVVIRYKKPDGTIGEYDTLPDGTQAWRATGNLLTVSLVPQVLTTAGSVVLYTSLYYGEAVMQTFALEIYVQAPTAGTPDYSSRDYAYMTNVLRGPLFAQAGQILMVKAVDDYGRVTEISVLDAAQLVNENGSAVLHKSQTLAEDQKIRARANIGAASQVEMSYISGKFTAKGLLLPDEKTAERYILYAEKGKLVMEKE